MAADREKGFAKTDMERVALFQEMGYICIGDKYKAANSCMWFVISHLYNIHFWQILQVAQFYINFVSF